MISIAPINNTSINFGTKPKTELVAEKPEYSNNTIKRVAIPTLAMLMYMNAIPAETSATEPEYLSEARIERVQNNTTAPLEETWNKTQLGFDELLNAPNPEITINGKKLNATIVVDTKTNKLYRYDKDGNIQDGYHVATGKIGRNGKSITTKGIRYVDHKETYPYSTADGTKRKKNPSAYGPKLLYLTVIDPKTGENLGSTGEFIHGNNKPSSIGTHDSKGCIRMDNEVIKKIVKEVPVGSYVLIK